MERCVPFERCFNFRDLGGYLAPGDRRTSWRRLFRSDSLHYMTQEDTERARDELRIVTIVDLRQPERARPPALPAVRYENLPLHSEEQGEGLIPRLRPATADAFEEMGSVRTQGSGAAKALILASRCPPTDTKWVGLSPFRLPR